MEHLWIAIVLVAAALQTARNAGQKYLSGHLSALSATWIRFVFGLPFALVYLFLITTNTSFEFDIFNLGFLLPCGLAALCQLSGTAFLMILFRLRNFAIGSTYVRTEVVVAAFIGTIFFDEFVSLMGWVAIFISVSGVIVISVIKFNLGKQNSFKNFFDISAGIGLLSGLGFALGSFFIREASLSFEDDNFVLTAAITLVVVLSFQTIGLGLYIMITQPRQFYTIKKLWRPSLFVGFTSAIGSIGWFTAMTIQRIAYVKALAQIEFIFALFVSILFFGEKPTRQEFFGMSLVAIGILVLVLFAN
ncbi:MAG: EamA family transporter [Rhodospirillaceae bacterium]|nr:EamA family transporter [Rhodospirillaceae bacterium]